MQRCTLMKSQKLESQWICSSLWKIGKVFAYLRFYSESTSYNCKHHSCSSASTEWSLINVLLARGILATLSPDPVQSKSNDMTKGSLRNLIFAKIPLIAAVKFHCQVLQRHPQVQNHLSAEQSILLTALLPSVTAARKKLFPFLLIALFPQNSYTKKRRSYVFYSDHDYLVILRYLLYKTRTGV